MKKILILLLAIGFFSCNQKDSNLKDLQNQINNLESKLDDSYKPGFGELMSNVQSHHSKLWFAGQSENWKLAEFEVKELNEIIADILKYQSERKESKMIEMINPSLDSVNIAIQQKNATLFNNSYISLTNSCNSCHLLTEFEFNVVKIPEYQPFSNQEFNLKK